MIVNKHLKLYEALTIASRYDKAFIVNEDEGVWKRVLKFSPSKELFTTSLYYSLTDCYWKLMHLNGWNADNFQDIVCKWDYFVCTDIEDLFEDYSWCIASRFSGSTTESVAEYCNRNRFKCAVRKRVISKATADRLLLLCDRLQREFEGV